MVYNIYISIKKKEESEKTMSKILDPTKHSACFDKIRAMVNPDYDKDTDREVDAPRRQIEKWDTERRRCEIEAETAKILREMSEQYDLAGDYQHQRHTREVSER